VQLLAPQLIPYLCKPQRLLFDHPEFYIIHDYVTNTYALCTRDLTMIDVDCDQEDAEAISTFRTTYLTWLIEQCEIHRDWKFGVYQTRKGFHVFVLHQICENAEERAQLQLQLQCDFYYTIFTYLIQGCCIRLNAKAKETLPLYPFVGFLGKPLFFVAGVHNKTNPNI